jgi:hexosaminidase
MSQLEPDFPSIIPLPANLIHKQGAFAFGAATVIVTDSANGWNATYLREFLKPPTGYPLPIQTEPSTSMSVLYLTTDEHLAHLGPEGYLLDISPHALRIAAPEARGVFYGIQTLRQLLPPAIERRDVVPDVVWQVPCVTIEDKPRFKWRGFMLDEGRHFLAKKRCYACSA